MNGSKLEKACINLRDIMLNRKLDTKEYMQCNLIVKWRLKIGKTMVKKDQSSGYFREYFDWEDQEGVFLGAGNSLSITCKSSLAMYS